MALRDICTIGSHLITVPHLPNEAVGKKTKRGSSPESGRSFPTKPRRSRLQPRDRLRASSCPCTRCLAFHQSLSSFSTNSRFCCLKIPSTIRSLDSYPPYSQCRATLLCQTMTTISKDAQQSSYPYVMDSRRTKPSTDDMRRFIAR